MIASHRSCWSRVLVSGLLISLGLYAQEPLPVTPTQSTDAKQTDTKEDIAALKAQLRDQQRQLEELRAAMEKQQQALENATKKVESVEARRVLPAASLGEVASIQPVLPMPAIATPASPYINPAGSTIGAQTQQPGKGDSPLSFRIGAANFTPLGFVDFISTTRSTNTGASVNTGFGTIPFANTVPGGLSETRFSLQNSRIGLRVDSVFRDIKVMGYLESDFLGNAPNGLYVTSNSDTLRLRLFFVDLRTGNYGFTAGQTWSLLTPNRVRLNVLPSDLFYTQDVDTNYVAGLTWARQAGVRFTWAPTKNFAWAVALENPEQYIGSAGVVGLPKTLGANTGFVAQFSNNSANSTPNLVPDILSKIAFDGGPEGHRAHFEIAGLVRTFKSFNPLTTGAGADTRFTTQGYGGSANLNLELVRGLRFLTNNYWSNGGGRYVQGLVPDFAIRSNGSISPIHVASTVTGLEYQVNPKTIFYGYYSGIYAGRSSHIDTDGKTFIGYGVPGGSLNANRTIQEATFGMIDNFWKSPQYGALSLNLQYSYVTRSPWTISTPGTPNNAETHMGFVDLRYTLP